MGIVSRQSSESTLKSLNRHRLQTRTQLSKLPLRLTPATLHIFFSQHARDVSRHFAAVPVEQFPEPYGVHRLDIVVEVHVVGSLPRAWRQTHLPSSSPWRNPFFLSDRSD